MIWTYHGENAPPPTDNPLDGTIHGVQFYRMFDAFDDFDIGGSEWRQRDPRPCRVEGEQRAVRLISIKFGQTVMSGPSLDSRPDRGRPAQHGWWASVAQCHIKERSGVSGSR